MYAVRQNHGLKVNNQGSELLAVYAILVGKVNSTTLDILLKSKLIVSYRKWTLQMYTIINYLGHTAYEVIFRKIFLFILKI